MTRRARPHYRGGSPISAAKQNQTAAEAARLTGLNTSGGISNTEMSYDSTPGRMHLPPRLPEGLEFYIKNQSGEEIPAYGCIELTQLSSPADPAHVGERPIHFGGIKPTGDGGKRYAFNGPHIVKSNGFALVRKARAKPTRGLLAYGVDRASLVAWESYLSPVANSWELEEGSYFQFCGYFEDYPDECYVLTRPPSLGVVGVKVLSVNDDDPDDIIATCRITSRPCGIDQVEEEYEGTIEVHDQMMKCLFNQGVIVDFRGWCVYQKADDSEDQYAECKWQMGDLCCEAEAE